MYKSHFVDWWWLKPVRGVVFTVCALPILLLWVALVLLCGGGLSIAWDFVGDFLHMAFVEDLSDF